MISMAPNSDFFILILNTLTKEIYDSNRWEQSKLTDPNTYITNIFVLMDKVIDNGCYFLNSSYLREEIVHNLMYVSDQQHRLTCFNMLRRLLSLKMLKSSKEDATIEDRISLKWQ